VRLTPEDSMDVQLKLRSDIAMVLDECTPYPATEQQARASMERSMRWAERSHQHYYRELDRGVAGSAPDSVGAPFSSGPLAENRGPPGGLFAIVQGGMHTNLRQASLEA